MEPTGREPGLKGTGSGKCCPHAPVPSITASILMLSVPLSAAGESLTSFNFDKNLENLEFSWVKFRG